METTVFWDNLAIESYKFLLKKNPRSGLVYNNMGLAYLRLQQATKAIRSFKKAIKYAEGHTEARYHLGRIYQSQGLTGMAIRCFVEFHKTKQEKDGRGGDFVSELIERLQLMENVDATALPEDITEV